MAHKAFTIGAISDTHMPYRWDALPASVFTMFKDVDLILHAGDVGELWVLDQLTAIAPVAAVHGNDESEAAQETLPYTRLVPAHGKRLVLQHGHWQDPALETASREEDDWLPKLDRWSRIALDHGAEVLVFGHTHIPMVVEHRGVTLINPGAIASASWSSRQVLQLWH